MPLPHFLAGPTFHLIYSINRRMEGGKTSPIRCLPKSNRENKPFTEGMVYITHAGDFPDKRPHPLLDHFNAEIEEWGSTNPITPLARIKVKPEDFPYLDKAQFSL